MDCAVEGCGPAVRLAKGYCNKHYQAWYKHGDPLYVRERLNKVCKVVGCLDHATSRQLCKHHYMRTWRYGSPESEAPERVDELPIARFLRQVTENHETGCWEWQASVNTKGYASFSTDRTRIAHRWAYEYYVGPIPNGLMLDHQCRVRHCVNPKHMRPLTNSENQEHKPYDQSKGTSRYRGVSLHKATGRWVAYFNNGKKQIYLGMFVCELDAAECARQARLGSYTYNDLDILDEPINSKTRSA